MRVLLVDDEREFVTTLSNRLSLRGVGTDVVFTGQKALDYVRTRAPDVIVLDLNMPGLDGMDCNFSSSILHLKFDIQFANHDIRGVVAFGCLIEIPRNVIQMRAEVSAHNTRSESQVFKRYVDTGVYVQIGSHDNSVRATLAFGVLLIDIGKNGRTG